MNKYKLFFCLEDGKFKLAQVIECDLKEADNGVFVFTNLPKDKYKLELYYGNEDLYITTHVKASKNHTTYKNLKMKKDMKPKKK